MKLKKPHMLSPLNLRGELGKRLHKSVIKLRSKMLVYLTHKMALPILKIIRKPILFPYSIEALSNLPKNTLGNDLHLFLQEKNLTLLPYYAKHDLKHILLQYDTTDEGEVCLQCFMLGNNHFSFPVVATVLYGFFTMPEYWKNFIKAYRRGAACAQLHSWNWFSILSQNTFSLQQKINTNDNIF